MELSALREPCPVILVRWPEDGSFPESLTPSFRFPRVVPSICQHWSLERVGGGVQALSRPMARQAAVGSSEGRRDGS